MIAFIEGRMRIPMGTVTKDYLRAHRLAPTQCAPNIFRILGSVDALNERMSLNLTHHDVNWIYNLHHLMAQGYYLKSRYPEVRLIQCLPDSNKVLKKGLLDCIRGVARWSPLSDKRGDTRWGSRSRFIISKLPHFLFLLFVFIHEFSFDLRYFLLMIFFVFSNGFAEKKVVVPNFNLVNQLSLDKILKAEVFVHIDGQLRVAHLILDYIPISKSF